MTSEVKLLDEFQRKLYPDNSFYSGTKNDSMYVTSKTIVIPNYLDEVTIFDMNGAVLPKTVGALANVEKTYSMTQWGVEPITTEPIANQELYYAQQVENVDMMIKGLNDYVAETINYEWTVTSVNSTVATTGAARLNIYNNAAAKAITMADLRNASKILNMQNVPLEGRRLLVDPQGYNDIITLTELQGSDALTTAAFTNGAVIRVAGFDVFMRSNTTSFILGGLVKSAVGAAPIATDRAAFIAFHPNFVRYATGTKMNAGIQIFSDENNPTYYSTINSAYTRVGASTSYLEDATNITKGVVTILEAV